MLKSENLNAVLRSIKMLMICKTLSSNFSSSRHDRKKLNTDSESAIKTVIKKWSQMHLKIFMGSPKMPPEHF